MLIAKAKYSLFSLSPSILECLPSNLRIPFKIKYTEGLLHSQLKAFVLPGTFFTFFYLFKKFTLKYEPGKTYNVFNIGLAQGLRRLEYYPLNSVNYNIVQPGWLLKRSLTRAARQMGPVI